MLIAGDIHLWAIEDLIADFDLPVHVVAGNHATTEHKKQLRDFFADDFKVNGRESDYYSFVHKGVRFIGICNAIHSDHVGHLSSEFITPPGQSEWLETELNKTEKAIYLRIRKLKMKICGCLERTPCFSMIWLDAPSLLLCSLVISTNQRSCQSLAVICMQFVLLHGIIIICQ